MTKKEKRKDSMLNRNDKEIQKLLNNFNQQ
jgi:hypothetical protein